MPHSLNKTIEARKLHARTLTPLSGSEVTVPFGALIDGIERDRDMVRFRYLGEPYTCPYERLESALDGDALRPPAPAPASAPPPSSPEATPEVPRVSWSRVESRDPALKRAEVPGGWLVVAEAGGALSLAFYPDPNHLWA